MYYVRVLIMSCLFCFSRNHYSSFIHRSPRQSHNKQPGTTVRRIMLSRKNNIEWGRPHVHVIRRRVVFEWASTFSTRTRLGNQLNLNNVVVKSCLSLIGPGRFSAIRECVPGRFPATSTSAPGQNELFHDHLFFRWPSRVKRNVLGTAVNDEY